LFIAYGCSGKAFESMHEEQVNLVQWWRAVEPDDSAVKENSMLGVMMRRRSSGNRGAGVLAMVAVASAVLLGLGILLLAAI
jgi:hypothetical protein